VKGFRVFRFLDIKMDAHNNISPPLDLSNEGAFHGALASAARHQAYVRGELKTPSRAIEHQINAVQIINK
jgi:hypothetical protein